MRILVDTNILFSALLFPGSTPAEALNYVVRYHDIFLCDQNIAEFKKIVSQKSPKNVADVEKFLQGLHYKEIKITKKAIKQIRDATDQPILNAAVENKIDIILTGDKDFLSMDIKHPKCMNSSDFLKSEGIKKV